jgi:hypothetical protein
MESLAFDTGTSSNKTTRLVADLVSFKNFRNWIDMFPKYKWYEDIQSTLFSYFDACHTFSQEDKLECLQKLIMEQIEKKIKGYPQIHLLLKNFLTNKKNSMN